MFQCGKNGICPSMTTTTTSEPEILDYQVEEEQQETWSDPMHILTARSSCAAPSAVMMIDEDQRTVALTDSDGSPTNNNGQQQQQQQQQGQFQHEHEIEEQMKKFLLVEAKESQSLVDEVVDEEQEEEELSMTSSVKFLARQADAIDLDFVEEYDTAFNIFLTCHSKFLIANPDLMHNIRIIKLQKLVEGMEQDEYELQAQLEKTKQEKQLLENGWHHQLRDASGKKAARETHLQLYLGNIHYNTKCMEAQLTWHLICDAQQHVIQNEHFLQQQQQQQQIKAAVVAVDDNDVDAHNHHRLDLISSLPIGPDFDELRNAMLAPPITGYQLLTDEQEKDVQQFQMELPQMASMVKALKKKLAYQKATTTKRHAWVESVLLQMDDNKTTMQQLKMRFQKISGVPLE